MKANIIEGCPSCSSIGELAGKMEKRSGKNYRLSHWPPQIKLMGTVIPFLNKPNISLLLPTPRFAVPNFRKDFLRQETSDRLSQAGQCASL